MDNNNLDYYNQFTLKGNSKHESRLEFKEKQKDKESIKSKSNKKPFHIVFLIIALGVLIFIANAFSNLLAFSTVTLYESNAIVLNSYEVYMLQVDEFDAKLDAENLSQKVKMQGGAGAIIFDSTYKVIVSVYDDLSDAQNVLEKIRGQYPNSIIYTMNLNRLKLEKNPNTNDFEGVEKTLEIFKITAENLMNLSFKLDSSTLSSNECKTEIINLYNKINKINKTFDDYSSILNDENCVIARAKIDQVCSLVKQIIDDNNLSVKLSAQLKSGAINSYLLQNELAMLVA